MKCDFFLHKVPGIVPSLITLLILFVGISLSDFWSCRKQLEPQGSVINKILSEYTCSVTFRIHGVNCHFPRTRTSKIFSTLTPFKVCTYFRISYLNLVVE